MGGQYSSLVRVVQCHVGHLADAPPPPPMQLRLRQLCSGQLVVVAIVLSEGLLVVLAGPVLPMLPVFLVLKPVMLAVLVP